MRLGPEVNWPIFNLLRFVATSPIHFLYPNEWSAMSPGLTPHKCFASYPSLVIGKQRGLNV